MKCVKIFLYCYLIVSVVLEVGSIKNYPADKNLISEEDRRGAERLENNKPTKIPESESSESKKRGLFLSAIHRSPTSLIHPSRYDTKETIEEGYDVPRPTSTLGDGRPHYVPTGSRGGYIAHYPTPYYPPEYGGGYDHSGGGIYGHSGGGFEYPVGGYGHSTGIGHHGGLGGGGGYKSPLALKSLLLPLAGIALLGAAAALTANPVLLQLGVINGRRRRRGLIQVSNDVYPANHVIKPDKN